MEQATSLEVNVISAESLRFPTGTIGKNAFVVVGTDSCNRRVTAVEHRGGAYPSWNEKLTVPFPPQVQSIQVDVRCKTALGEKSVSRTTIAVSDFVGAYDIPCGYLHFLSYRLHDKGQEKRDHQLGGENADMAASEMLETICATLSGAGYWGFRRSLSWHSNSVCRN